MIHFYGDNVHCAPDQHDELNFNGASLLKNQSTERHVASHGHIVIPCKPNSL